MAKLFKNIYIIIIKGFMLAILHKKGRRHDKNRTYDCRSRISNRTNEIL